MSPHLVRLLPADVTAEIPTGALVAEAIRQAGLPLVQPCGGQGRCGRCAVIVEQGAVRRRSTIRLSAADLQAGYALACQAVVEGDATVLIPEQERIERRLVTDRSARGLQLPFTYDPAALQSVVAVPLELPQPSLQDSRDDLSRLRQALAERGFDRVEIALPTLRQMSEVLRQAEWSPWALLEREEPLDGAAHLIELSAEPPRPVGLALDIGTTTVTAYLMDLATGELLNSAAEYNGQIAAGEDVISRIVYAGKGDGLRTLGDQVRQTIHELLGRLHKRTGVAPLDIHKVVVVGNTTMIHLFLGLPPENIRLTPYIPTANRPPRLTAAELGLGVHPLAGVECLPGVASYVGADITAGALAAGMPSAESLTLFIDVGTNGEIVLGTRDWMVSCACSAGPAFEGAGVVDGMRATQGAVEEAWVHSQSFEPTYRVIGGGRPRGICGSGLISLLSELFVTGAIDHAGNFKLDLGTTRIRQGEHGPEYVLAWAAETEHGRDIALTKVDVDNLMRAKAAIYAGFSVLASSVGVDLNDVQQVLVGGAFGKYINVEKAIQIGLLPDLPWERFQFLGNTAVVGAAYTLLSAQARQQVYDIADRMSYVELSADNAFYEAFTAALFLPHTEIERFPSVAEVWQRQTSREGLTG
jgi:uncharacterized 2Fe-2S/4Fe-4S cluster protein (DUF4445 family)